MTELAPVVGNPVQGNAYLIPVQYDTSGEWQGVSTHFPAFVYAATGSEDDLYTVTETTMPFTGLPKWHLVPFDELRELPDTFKNVVGYDVPREEWEERSAEMMSIMDAIVKAAIKVRGSVCACTQPKKRAKGKRKAK